MDFLRAESRLDVKRIKLNVRNVFEIWNLDKSDVTMSFTNSLAVSSECGIIVWPAPLANFARCMTLRLLNGCGMALNDVSVGRAERRRFGIARRSEVTIRHNLRLSTAICLDQQTVLPVALKPPAVCVSYGSSWPLANLRREFSEVDSSGTIPVAPIKSWWLTEFFHSEQRTSLPLAYRFASAKRCCPDSVFVHVAEQMNSKATGRINFRVNVVHGSLVEPFRTLVG